MSVRSIYSIILLLAATLTFIACDKLIYDQPGDEPANGGAKVFLSVNIQAARESGLRAINEDVEFDDRVHHLALLVFDSNTGERLADFFGNIGKERTNYSFTLELTPGQRDFYFVANMPETDFDKVKIPDRAAMNNYMKTFTSRDLDPDLYLGAGEFKGFPMSRVYSDQDITQGGTPYQPKPFHPDGDVLVRLIRVVAKLEVNFGANIDKVENVYFRNAFRQFSLTAPAAATYTPQLYYTASPVNPKGNPLKFAGSNTYLYYMPEALMNSPLWGTAPHQPVNYFVVETKDGQSFDIPIITNAPVEIPDANYMKFATGKAATQPDYNIYRNHRYLYTVSIPAGIEITYQVNPWEKVAKQLYMGYGYNVAVNGTNITINNTVEACAPHGIVLKTVFPYTFSDASVEKPFKNGVEVDALVLSASESYMLASEPVSGDSYLQVWYNGVLVKTFTKP